MKRFDFADVTVIITATAWAGFSAWLGSQPDALLDAFGVQASTPQMRTEIRAFYGGVEAAIAVAMIVLWKRGDTSAALLIGGLPLAGSAGGRLSGWALDGYSPMHLGLATLELIGAACCFIGYRSAVRCNDRR